jgi:protein gp37
MVYTCFTSDFLLEDADAWRADAWRMIRSRPDLSFFFVTKRIGRFEACLPEDWGDGYSNVSVCCTAENQGRADERLPVFIRAPIKHKSIICEPLLGPVNLLPYLGAWTEEVITGGESGSEARVCDYDWVLDLRRQCVLAGVPFHFKQTGANFRKDGKRYRIERRYQQEQARRAAIDYIPSGAIR